MDPAAGQGLGVGEGESRDMSLYWRIFLLNASVLLVAVLLLLGPVTVSTPVLAGEATVLGAGLVAMLLANALLLRLGLAPLQRLTRAMRTADLPRPGRRATVAGRGELADLTRTYNTMLDRLEAERAASTARALSAQEDDGRGIGRAPEGAGIGGMRERALLIGARLTIREGEGGGTEVHLSTPSGKATP